MSFDSLAHRQGKLLVICEKPSVAKDVVRALPGSFTQVPAGADGPGFVVSYAFGHLLSEKNPEDYKEEWKKWDFASLPMIPAVQLYVPRDSDAASHLAKIKALAIREDVVGFVNACDAGREGELIFKLIYEHLGVGKPVWRAWFSSMTAEALTTAFKALLPDSDMAGLEQAARARSMADWLVGLNATRAATIKLSGGSGVVSIGRVQTPTLAMIANRDTEIANFVSTPFWQLKVDLANALGTVPTMWYTVDGEGAELDRLLDKATATKTQTEVQSAPTATVTNVEVTDRSEQPPGLFSLNELQKEANKKFGFTAQKTLTVAQALYETHKVATYPRTDSRYIPPDVALETVDTLKSLASSGPLKSMAQKAVAAGFTINPTAVNAAKVTDHHAILPTGQTASALSADEEKIYELIVSRFVANFFPPFKTTNTVVRAKTDAPVSHTLKGSGRVIVDMGWREVEGLPKDEQPSLPMVQSGDVLAVQKVTLAESKTKPPSKFSDGSLLAAMESAGEDLDEEAISKIMKGKGLGTPATRAAIIERLIKVGYVDRSGKHIVATSKGLAVIDVLGDHSITSPQLTGGWEQKLHQIEDNAFDVALFQDEIKRYTTEVVAWFADKTSATLRAARPVIAPCPRCDGSIVEGKVAWGCTSWKSKEDQGCKFLIWFSKFDKKRTKKDLMAMIASNTSDGDYTPLVKVVLGPCPRCDGEIVERQASYGCTSWKAKDNPGCGYTIWKVVGTNPPVTIEEAKELMQSGADNAPAPRDALGPCPSCKKGTIRAMRSGKGWSCDSWSPSKKKNCGYVIWASEKGSTTEKTPEEALLQLQADAAK